MKATPKQAATLRAAGFYSKDGEDTLWHRVDFPVYSDANAQAAWSYTDEALAFVTAERARERRRGMCDAYTRTHAAVDGANVRNADGPNMDADGWAESAAAEFAGWFDATFAPSVPAAPTSEAPASPTLRAAVKKWHETRASYLRDSRDDDSATEAEHTEAIAWLATAWERERANPPAADGATVARVRAVYDRLLDSWKGPEAHAVLGQLRAALDGGK